MILLQKEEGGSNEFTRDLMQLASGGYADQRAPGGATVQGAGFRR
jgi:hypothetical protein